MDSPLPSPRLARKASSLPAALSPFLKTLGLEEEDPEDVFEIHAKEGAGAFGRVFRASYRRAPTRLAALKVIPVALEAGQRGEDIENVRREIQFLRECDHPNVVAFYGAYYKDQALWVAMEYCGGGSVGDVSRRRKLGESEIAVIARGALQGLEYLHARKKIHRDIKGGNILLTSTGEVKIADFGVSAQLKDTLSRRGTFVGTPYWMSPEMIQDSDYDYKSDIWSLGITIIELADQRPPLFDEHPMRVLIQIPRNPPPSVKAPHAWTPLFAEFLQFCLRKDPKERPSAAECLAHAFLERVRDVPFVFAEGPDARQQAAQLAAHAEAKTDVEAAVEAAAATAPRTIGSLTTSDSEAMADDVTLKAPGARPQLKATPLEHGKMADGGLRVASLRRRSLELERERRASELVDELESAASEEADDSSRGALTPRDSESVAEDVWTPRPSSRSSRSDDDDDEESRATEGNDASTEGFAFRRAPASSASPPSSPAVAASTLPSPQQELSSGDELLGLSVDDSFEMPAMALISRIHAAASTRASHSVRPQAAPATKVPQPLASSTATTTTTTPVTPLPLPLASAPSPARPHAARKASVDELRGAAASNEAARQPPPPRRELNSFSRTDAVASRASVAAANHDQASHDDDAEPWRHPLAQLTAAPSHDRVNALLSSLSASTARLLLAPQPANELQASTEWSGPNVASLRGRGRPVPPPVSSSLELTASTSTSQQHFIGAPFRVSHELNVRFNTLDARFEGVPAGADWAGVHRQFGLALAQLRGRSNVAAHDRVPALAHMLRRELLRRDGLECKYVYRVSPDQGEVQRAKRAIDSGAFAPASVSDPHVFASLLKLWLRELPTPLLGAVSKDELAKLVAKLAQPEAAPGGASTDVVFAVPFAEIHATVSDALLARLPVPERGVLLWLVDHMLEVMAKSARNAMTAQSLAVVLAPSVYRWASATPADASAISKQVATLLRVLLAWRQRCRGGGGGEEALRDAAVGATTTGGDPRQLSVRRRPTSKNEMTTSQSTTLSGLPTSLRESLDGLRSSLTFGGGGTASRDSTVSNMLRRSSVPGASTHFVSASTGAPFGVAEATPSHTVEPQAGERSVSLETLLRETVVGLWSELPLSIMLDDPLPPIVRSLHTTFQRRVLLLVKANARRDRDRRWAEDALAKLENASKAPQRLDKELTLPLSLKPFTRWIAAAMHLEAFVTLLKQERHARERFEKHWPKHGVSAELPHAAELPTFMLGHILELADTDRQRQNQATHKAEMEPSTNELALRDGAATLLRVLHKHHTDHAGIGGTSALPLAEELVKWSLHEPMLANMLVALSGEYTRRYHLEKQHHDVVRMVEQVIKISP